jgi:hypothetical protein
MGGTPRRTGVALAFLIMLFSAAPASGDFERRTLPLAVDRAFDVGVVDVGADGRLNPFTLNHKYRSSLLSGSRDLTAELGLSPSYGFPGFEYLDQAPADLTKPGLYLYATDHVGTRDPAVLHLRSSGVGSRGTIAFAVREDNVAIAHTHRATILRRTDGGRIVFDFDVAPGGEVDIEVQHIDVPIQVRGVTLPTYVGADAVLADGPDFVLTLRDRHSYALADFTGDGRQDIFIASGGLGGEIVMPDFAGAVEDEMMAAQPDGTFRNVGGLAKGDCRARASAAPDVDGDGSPDIFVSCEGDRPLLYSRGNGWTRETLPAEGEQYRWANVDRDLAPELLAFRDDRMVVWSRGVHRDYSVRLRGRPAGPPAIGDLFGTGRTTIYVPSRSGSTLIDGKRGTNPVRRGLPRASTAAAFVDYDNDGRREVHLGGDGLYELRRGRYRRLRALGFLRVGSRHPLLSWVDLDNDGRRDLLATKSDRLLPTRIHTMLLRNRTKGGNWLEVDTTDALTARVRVRAAGRTQTGWVGESEGSRWSDGHHRVYFGLGRARWATVTLITEQGRSTLRTRTNRLIDVPPEPAL